MSVWDDVRAVLESDRRTKFLAAVGWRMAIAGRELYISQSPDDIAQARACNEVVIAIFEQMGADVNPAVTGYPDEDFFPVLSGKADAGNARGHLQQAILTALRQQLDVSSGKPGICCGLVPVVHGFGVLPFNMRDLHPSLN